MKAKHVILAVVGIPLIVCGFIFYRYVTSVEVPAGLKITDCTNRVTKVNFKFPAGRYYHLMLVTGANLTNAFSGQIHISDGGASVVDYPIDSSRPEPRNWLQSMGVPWSSSLTGDPLITNSPPLYSVIHAQEDYTIEIDFSNEPPPSMSIWLYWLQAYKDRGR
jgi:hypothetical protein